MCARISRYFDERSNSIGKSISLIELFNNKKKKIEKRDKRDK